MGTMNIWNTSGTNKASLTFTGSSDVTVDSNNLSGLTGNVQTQLGLKANTADTFGIGQTWQDVTSSRALGTTYTNTTGKPIMVVITGNGATYQITVAGTLVASGNTGSTVTISTFIVQNGATYVVNLSGGLTKWSELR